MRIILSLVIVALFTLLLLINPVHAEHTNMLDQFLWKNRPILIFAETPQSPDYQTQIKILTQNKAALADRDVILLSITQNNVTDLNGETYEISAKNLRQEYNAQEGFHVILIGKDGGQKSHEQTVTSLKTFIELIDSMPMRQSEMRR